jgi:hypothetical protein
MSADRTGGSPAEEHLVRYRVTGADADTLRAFLAESGADTSCRPVAVQTATGLAVQVLLRRSQLEGVRALRSAGGLDIEEVEDVTAAQQAAHADLGPGTRYAQRGDLPHGLGRKE